MRWKIIIIIIKIIIIKILYGDCVCFSVLS